MTAGEHKTWTAELRFEIGPCALEVIEQLGIDVLEALDEHGPDAVVGAAASVRHEPPAVDVEIEIRADTPAELHRRLAEVLEALQNHADLEPLWDGRYAEHAASDRDVADDRDAVPA
jgi:hypothetical protein